LYDNSATSYQGLGIESGLLPPFPIGGKPAVQSGNTSAKDMQISSDVCSQNNAGCTLPLLL